MVKVILSFEKKEINIFEIPKLKSTLVAVNVKAMGQKKKKPLKRTVGRPSREKLGLEETVQVSTKVERSVIEKVKRDHGSISNALRYLATL